MINFRVTPWLLTLVLAWLLGCGDSGNGSTDSGSNQVGEGEGEGEGEGVALEMTDCEGGKLDSGTNLCWENPPSTGKVTWDEALTYCEDLTVGGHDDWRLPKIQELISLDRGCVSGATTGDLSRSQCGVTDPGCLGEGCRDTAACDACEDEAGPDDESGGCYWDPALSGDCELGFWSSSSFANDSYQAWYFAFSFGYLNAGDKYFDLRFRCVRGGP